MNAHEENFGIKNLNSVTIRAYSDLKIGNKEYKAGEPVLWLDKVQIAQLNENKRTVFARGGYHNLARVAWTDFYNLDFRFTNGLLSKTSMGFFAESGAIEVKENSVITVNKKEEVEVVGGIAKLLHNPLDEKLFIYSLDENGNVIEKIENYENKYNKSIEFSELNSGRILVDYYYNYTNNYTNYKITDKEMEGFFTIEGYADVKSEETGFLQTYFFEIPKAKITSNLEMNLGEKANPSLLVFDAIGLPVKKNGETVVCEMYLLDEDIMSDF